MKIECKVIQNSYFVNVLTYNRKPGVFNFLRTELPFVIVARRGQALAFYNPVVLCVFTMLTLNGIVRNIFLFTSSSQRVKSQTFQK